MPPSISISESKPRQQLPFGCMRLFFFIFFCAGSGVFYLIVIQPAYLMWQARSWRETPCRILESRVDRSRSSKGKGTYRVAMRYQYAYEGRTYTGDRYHFLTGSSSGRGAKDKAVADYPAGTYRTCFVDPAQPSQSVIRRTPSAEMWFGLFALPFLGVGCLAFLPEKKVTRLQARKFSTASPGVPVVPMRSSGSHAGGVLQAKENPKVRFYGTLFFAVFWNGIIGFILFAVLRSDGFKFSFPLLFLSLFVMIGLWLIGVAVYEFFRLFTPRIELVAQPTEVPLGRTFTVQWNFPTQSHKVHSLQLTLEGTEVATYRRGTKTTTDRSVFYRQTIAEAAALPAGSAAVEVPVELIHTFKARSNEITYSVRAQGVVPGLPDVDESFEITILPRPEYR